MSIEETSGDLICMLSKQTMIRPIIIQKHHVVNFIYLSNKRLPFKCSILYIIQVLLKIYSEQICQNKFINKPSSGPFLISHGI